jgi:hypothetical protein
VPKCKSGARWTGWVFRLVQASARLQALPGFAEGHKGVGPVLLPPSKTDAGCKRPETGHELRYILSYVQPSAEITQIKLGRV